MNAESRDSPSREEMHRRMQEMIRTMRGSLSAPTRDEGREAHPAAPETPAERRPAAPPA